MSFFLTSSQPRRSFVLICGSADNEPGILVHRIPPVEDLAPDPCIYNLTECRGSHIQMSLVAHFYFSKLFMDTLHLFARKYTHTHTHEQSTCRHVHVHVHVFVHVHMHMHMYMHI